MLARILSATKMKGQLTMPLILVPTIESGLSSLPPTCDDEATTRGGQLNETICKNILRAPLLPNLEAKAA